MDEFFKSLKISWDFNRLMNDLSKSILTPKTIKVRITEKQIGILEYCAFLAINDFHDLEKMTGEKMPPRFGDKAQTEEE